MQGTAWIDKLVADEGKAHLAFFGREFDLSDFATTLNKHGQEKIELWQRLLLEPHFLPRVKMNRMAELPGWLIRPTDHHYEVVYQGKVLREIDGKIQVDKQAHWLLGQSVLIDTRLKPAFDNGKQMYAQDYLQPTLSKLRKNHEITPYDYGSQGSRFGISADDEWEDHIKPALIADQRFQNITKWRLERGIEANVISQMYLHMPRKANGQTNTWQWYEEYFEDRGNRLCGGGSGCGGLADFHWRWSGGHWSNRGFCPLAVL